MSANQLRDTPGRLLLGWAVLFSALVVLAWRIHDSSGQQVLGDVQVPLELTEQQ